MIESFWARIGLFLLTGLFYIPGYLLTKDAIQDPAHYDITAIILGTFFNLFGFVGTLSAIFYKQAESYEFGYKSKLVLRILGSLICILFLYGGIKIMFQAPSTIEEKDVVTLRGTLENNPKFEKGAKSSTSLNLYFIEFPGFRFDVLDNEYLHYQTNFEIDKHVKDTIYFTILREEFEKKIAKTVKPNYLDKHGGWSSIGVYEVADQKQFYLPLSVHNKLETKDNKLGIYIGPIFLLIFSFNLLLIWAKEFISFFTKNDYPDFLIRFFRFISKK